METCGFSSHAFPAGLRVLVVDDDPTWLKILEKMLKKCSYEVTTCGLAREALSLLRERKEGFDIVISDVNMPDMDGFKLLEHVGLEMDLPVIMMSVDGETSRVMKGVQHGACDYLLKPIRMKELRNIWQHVFRKRIHEVRDIEGHEVLEEIQMLRNGNEQCDDGFLLSGVDLISGRKRKDVDNKHDDRTCNDPSSSKKARVVWTVDLHQKFVKAVNQIGFEKVGPKKILDLMGVPWLTRENVASHLQKYRLYLSRLQKENALKSSLGGVKQPDLPSKETASAVSIQSSITTQHNDIANGGYAFPGNKILVQNVDSKTLEGDLKGIIPMKIAEPKISRTEDSMDLQRSSLPRLGINQSLSPRLESEPKIAAHHSWSPEISSVRFKQEPKPNFPPDKRFNHQPLPMHHFQVDFAEPGIFPNPRPSVKENGKQTEPEVKSTYGTITSQGIRKLTIAQSTADLFSVHPESHLTDCHSLEPIPLSTWSVTDTSIEQIPFNDQEHSQKNLISGTGPAFNLWDEELDGYSSHGSVHPLNAGIENKDSFGYYQEQIADGPPELYDSLNFDYEYDLMEYHAMSQGLFIT